MSKVIFIPVSKKTKQFFLSKYGEEPIQVKQNQHLGKLFLLGLEKTPFKQKRKSYRDGCKLSFVLPTALKHQDISEDTLIKLSEYLDKYFQEQFIEFVTAQVIVRKNELQSIRSFLEYYRIETDVYDIETARKCWRDYKSRALKNVEI
jgi:hypothetical protein